MRNIRARERSRFGNPRMGAARFTPPSPTSHFGVFFLLPLQKRSSPEIGAEGGGGMPLSSRGSRVLNDK